MTAVEISRLHDDAVFRRTAAGQRALVGGHTLMPVEVRFLAMVTGYTPLRVLIDMGIDEGEVPKAIDVLCEQGLITLEDDATAMAA